MHRRSFAILILALTLSTVGCATPRGGTIVKYEPHQTLRITDVPRDGRYGLYLSPELTPRHSYFLQRGDPIGFKLQDGETLAVAGLRQDLIKTSLLNRTWYWKEMAQ